MCSPYKIYNDIEFCVKEVNHLKIKSIEINDAFYGGDSIEFLENMPLIEDLSIVSEKHLDLSILDKLSSLKILKLDLSIKKTLNLGSLQVEELSLNWSKNVKGLGDLTSVKKLSLTNYKSVNKDLRELGNLKNLKELELIKGNIESLYGIENNYNLSKISIFYIKSLRSLYPNENKNSTISDIEINGCTNIVDLGDLVTFRNVRKLILDNIGNLTSVKFISEFKELNYFVLLGSVIEDGDVSPCFGIDYVQFEEKDWYSHTFSEFKKLNGIEKRKRKISR